MDILGLNFTNIFDMILGALGAGLTMGMFFWLASYLLLQWIYRPKLEKDIENIWAHGKGGEI